MCGLGLYELYVNGKRVGDRVLEPAFTDYTKRVLYSTYDAAPYLKQGENEIEVVLGDGWYNQTTRDTWGFFRAPWRDCVKMIFRMDYDGKTLVSDESWQVSYGELISNALRTGEFYDYREGRDYHPAVLTPPPGGLLYPSQLPPIRECEVLKPVRIINADGYRIYDFGKNISGYCSAVLAGKRGDLAYIEHSDRCDGKKLDNASNSMYVFNCTRYQTDGYVLLDGVNEVKPRFVYHGFRYAAVYTDAEVLEVRAHFVHTDLKPVGHFECSSDKVNRLYAMSTNAILSNYHGLPTDCPHREKNGWTGDAQLSLEASVYNFDMHRAYVKWLEDFTDNQLLTGQISAIIPTCGWGYNWGSGPAWDVALFRITKAVEYYYGDKTAAKKMYPYLKRYYDYLSGYDRGGLLCVGLGDWNYPKNITFEVCPTELTDSCYYAFMARTIAGFAADFEPGAEAFYLAEAERIERVVLAKYADNATLTGMAALTYFNLLDRSEGVVRYLEDDGYVLHTGILGAKYVFETLGRCGRSDVALKLLERTEYPSFGYWAENGQTALCEDFELTNSLNHHMYSCIAEYMIRRLVGLNMGEGQRCFTLEPSLPDGLNRVLGHFITLNGKLEVAVERAEDGVWASVTVPANCRVTFKDQTLYHGSYRVKV